MRSTLLSVYVITEAKNIFLKFINKLKCYFNLNIFLLLLKVDDIAYCLFAIVKVFDICLKSVRLMESFLILAALSLIFKLNCKPRIKICSLMKPALYRVCFESCLFKYFSIRKKCNSCTSIIFSACTNLFKRRCCFSTLVSLLVHTTINSYLNLKPYRKCINYRCTNAVKSSRYLISAISELATCMKYCKYNLNRRYSGFRMDSDRNTSSIILDSCCSIIIKSYIYLCTKTRKMFIH